MEDLSSFASVMRSLRDTDNRHVVDTGVFHHLANGRQLAFSAVDKDQVGPLTARSIRILLLEPREPAFQHLAHHCKVVAGLGLFPLDVELAIVVLSETLGT